MLSEKTNDWLKSPCHDLNTEQRRGAGVQRSFRPPELKYTEMLKCYYGVFAK